MDLCLPDGLGDCTRELKNEQMMTAQQVLVDVKSEPFRPFRLHKASGRTFDIRHPEMVKVLKSSILVFKIHRDTTDLLDDWESISLMLTESVSHLGTPIS
jgi:hypothetical protein